MRREKVDSSSLASAGYDRASRTLEVEFRNGYVYRYAGVGPAVYQRFLRAPSKGTFVNFYVKPAYRFTRVR